MDKCPPGKLALYTNIDFNNKSEVGETSDILIMGPDVQLDSAILEKYGFIVGEHDGISSIVNNMNQPATLVAGTKLDGDTLSVDAGQQIRSLSYYERSSGATWNDATNSVVSASVTTVSLTMKLENGTSLVVGDSCSASLQITNNSSTDVTAVTVTASSSNTSVLTIGSFTPSVNIPAGQVVTVHIPVTGIAEGLATLDFSLKTPFGIINSQSNTLTTPAFVSTIKVNLTMSPEDNISLVVGDSHSTSLQITNNSSIDVTAATVRTSGSNRAITVGSFTPSVDIPAGQAVTVHIPVTAIDEGWGPLRYELDMPKQLDNTGDKYAQSNFFVSGIPVDLTMSPENNISLEMGDSYSTSLQITNNSNTDVTAATVTASSSNASILTVGSFTPSVDIPAGQVATVHVPVTAIAEGSAELHYELNMPKHIDNTGDKNAESIFSVSGIPVDLTMYLETEISLQPTENYSALLQFVNNSDTTVTAATLMANSSDPNVFDVKAFSSSVNIPANVTTNFRIPLLGVSEGKETLSCNLTMPAGIENTGDNTISTAITVTTVRQLQVTVGSVTHWQDVWPSKEFIYSYALTMSAANTQVRNWVLSFLLPDGASLNKAWLESQSSWVVLDTEKSVNGNIYLNSQPGHVIAPGKNVNFTLQINYPKVSTEYETLDNLILMQV